MSIRQLSNVCKRTINLRLIALSFALLTLLTMQHSLIRHALDHLGALPSQSSGVVAGKSAVVVFQAVQKDLMPEANCLKCIEDLAHSVVLPSAWVLPLAQTVHIQALRALAPNQVFLSPERANQRGPPQLV